jgi:hypothetical protein
MAMADVRDLEGAIEQFPTQEDIEKRAYEIYLESGREDGHEVEHWLIAEEELRRRQATRHSAIGPKGKTAVAGAVGGFPKNEK